MKKSEAIYDAKSKINNNERNRKRKI